jgi:hypothetical protein
VSEPKAACDLRYKLNIKSPTRAIHNAKKMILVSTVWPLRLKGSKTIFLKRFFIMKYSKNTELYVNNIRYPITATSAGA